MKRHAQASYEYIWAIAISFLFIVLAVHNYLSAHQKPIEVAAKTQNAISTTVSSIIATGSQ